MFKLIFLILSFCLCSSSFAESKKEIQWRDWSSQIFEDAKKENKLVILDLRAVWCHWCHVMEEKTYSDSAVIEILQKNFITVAVDQDSRPDISNHYQDYGWPATIIFNSKGEELAKKSGYIEKTRFLKILSDIVKNPVPEKEDVTEVTGPVDSVISAVTLKELSKVHLDGYDKKNKGWGYSHKYLQIQPVEWAMIQAINGDITQEKMAKESLDAAKVLVDPIWGGVYQYSANDGKWNEPHFEKIVPYQADYIKGYALGGAYFQKKEYFDVVLKISGYLFGFLQSPEGGFYTSQDADLIPGKHSEGYFKLSDKKRRALGIPKVDQHVYSRENGMVIQALLLAHEMNAQPKFLEESLRAANWILKNRRLQDGGFSHDQKDQAGPFLGDSLYMMAAFAELYKVTQDRKWIDEAIATAKFINKNFKGTSSFVTSSLLQEKLILKPAPTRDENTDLLRASNLLFHYTGNSEFKQITDHAMKHLAKPNVADELPAASALLADLEYKTDPLHLTVTGLKTDPLAQQLFAGALNYPVTYKRVDWINAEAGQKPLRDDVTYPNLQKSAVFICSASRCSLPIYSTEKLKEQIKRISKASGA